MITPAHPEYIQIETTIVCNASCTFCPHKTLTRRPRRMKDEVWKKIIDDTRGLTETQIRESLLRAFQQVGKQYDFNFEVETLGKITCSELPYHVYPGVDWETEEQLGQFTISPDQVAAQVFGEETPFQLLDFYHDGEHVDPAEASSLMRRLMAEG